ncbi:collagen alpha-1(I) chain-like [Macrobrachium nipponense]|uniref:collagen alpha-1(I) chain-like n=1 Tax=Macrobrachium nipponense TaxID=159736 RepID=UPI0030C88A20
MGSGQPFPGQEVDIDCCGNRPPDHGTRGVYHPPGPSRDLWQARPATDPGPKANINHPSRDPWLALPKNPGTHADIARRSRSRHRQPVLGCMAGPWPARSGTQGRHRPPVPDRAKPLPAHPGTRGGHHPPVLGAMADIAHPSGIRGGFGPPIQKPVAVLPTFVPGDSSRCPPRGARPARPSLDAPAARFACTPARPGSHFPPGDASADACPSRPGTCWAAGTACRPFRDLRRNACPPRPSRTLGLGRLPAQCPSRDARSRDAGCPPARPGTHGTLRRLP